MPPISRVVLGRRPAGSWWPGWPAGRRRRQVARPQARERDPRHTVHYTRVATVVVWLDYTGVLR
jgi:hypothetical protein